MSTLRYVIFSSKNYHHSYMMMITKMILMWCNFFSFWVPCSLLDEWTFMMIPTAVTEDIWQWHWERMLICEMITACLTYLVIKTCFICSPRKQGKKAYYMQVQSSYFVLVFFNFKVSKFGFPNFIEYSYYVRLAYG